MSDAPQQKIVIDLAGAMEKITPEMLDHTRDLMIEVLTKRAKEMQDALEAFANKVFYDNGDVTVSNTQTLTRDDFVRAYHAFKGTNNVLEKSDEAAI